MILQVSTSVRARILSLYQQGKDIQTIAEAVQVLPEAVETVVKAAAEKSRIVYVFADREEPATVIDVCNFTREIKITNLADDMISRAFGVKENPDWEDYEAFLESRCMPRTRYGIREELRAIGIDFYDPFLIVQKTRGRVYEDHQYLSLMGKEWIRKYDLVTENAKDDVQRVEKLRKYLRESEGEWKLDEDCY